MPPILFFKDFQNFTFKKEWNMVAALYSTQPDAKNIL